MPTSPFYTMFSTLKTDIEAYLLNEKNIKTSAYFFYVNNIFKILNGKKKYSLKYRSMTFYCHFSFFFKDASTTIKKIELNSTSYFSMVNFHEKIFRNSPYGKKII